MSAVEWPTPWGPISNAPVYALVILGAVALVGIVAYALLIRALIKRQRRD